MAYTEKQRQEKKELDASHADPANWKGPFYYNKCDPRILPPKRDPAMGVTINWANRRSVAVLVLMLILTLGVLLLFAYFVGRAS